MELQTEGLSLRTVTDCDLPEVARMWSSDGPVSLDEAREAIAYMTENHRQNKRGCIRHLCLAVFETGAEQIIGWCGLDGERPGTTDIFYSIDPVYRGRGYATQCAKRLLTYAFEEAGLSDVNGGCYRENKASFRVMEKAGMQPLEPDETGGPVFYMNEEIYLRNKGR